MKRLISLFLIFAMLMALGACGTSQPRKGTVTVETVDEFLAALGGAKQIVLKPGTYDLTMASNYGAGEESTNGFYFWEPLWDEQFQLVIRAHDVVISGFSSDDTRIVTAPRSAAVLNFRDCMNVTMENLTVGHTLMAEACEGPVLSASGCEGLLLRNLGLFGCGTMGLSADTSLDIHMENCEIYDCSGSGVFFSECSGILVHNSSFSRIGKDGYGWTVFGFSNCTDAQVSACNVNGATASHMLTAFGCGQVEFRECTFSYVNALESVFNLGASDVYMMKCQWEENNFSRWYVPGSIYAVDENWETFHPEAPQAYQREKVPAEARPVTIGPQRKVTASNVDELLAALASDTEITLTGTLYNLEEASDYGLTGGKYYHWNNGYDGPQLVIQGVYNLTIRAAGPDGTTISAQPRYANVLQFENCKNVTLEGFTAGHTKEPGECVGGVLRFDKCTSMLVNECGLFGCGTLGVDAAFCQDVQVINTNIYECSYGGIEAMDCDDFTVAGCDFWDLGGEFFRFSGVTNAAVDGQQVPEYYYGY